MADGNVDSPATTSATRIRVANTGNVTLTGVVVTDPLPIRQTSTATPPLAGAQTSGLTIAVGELDHLHRHVRR